MRPSESCSTPVSKKAKLPSITGFWARHSGGELQINYKFTARKLNGFFNLFRVRFHPDDYEPPPAFQRVNTEKYMSPIWSLKLL